MKENKKYLRSIIDSTNEESLKHMVGELKKTIHKENCLLENGVSFQINCNLRKF